jgi:hypothetical protein
MLTALYDTSENHRVNNRLSAILALVLTTAACSGGPPSPPVLSYSSTSVEAAAYEYVDKTVISIAAMGQRMELSQEGTASLGIRFEPTSEGVGVTLSVQELSAVISQPMGAPVTLDGSAVRGDLRFSLDRTGNATVLERPEVSDIATQMVSALGLAHTFFPGLPGRAVTVGDGWVDTVSYEGPEGPGVRSERAVLRYTATGDTVVAGRPLLVLSVEGSAESSADMEVGGMAISQSSTRDITGSVLWDLQNGLMFESVRTETGSGTVRVPIAPGPLPIQVEITRWTRLKGN